MAGIIKIIIDAITEQSGFSTYREQYLGHINRKAIMLIFK